MKLGVLISLDSSAVDEKFARVREMGFDYCQILAWDHELLTDDVASAILEATRKYDIKISTFWCGWSSKAVWDFYDGPKTIGIVPKKYRKKRTKELIYGADFAKKLGVKIVATHLGFIPENPNDPDFLPLASAVRKIANHCKDNGQWFTLETGQETPTTLLRLIDVVGCDNVGVNFDSANLILYGKANPIDALDILGKYVKDVHVKDGFYPTDSKNLGKQCKVGDGMVDFPKLIEKLMKMNYDGYLTIEREIKGEQQKLDIEETKKYLEKLLV